MGIKMKEKEGKTLWEMFSGWCKRQWYGKPPPPLPPEEQIYNPLKCKIGTSFNIDDLKYSGNTFIVNSILERKLDYGKRKLPHVDYNCRSTLSDKELFVKIRVYPHDKAGRDLQIAVLEKWDELDYDKDFKKLLDDLQFNTMMNEQVEASFWRINDVKTPYKAATKELSQIDNVVDITNGELWYWDYWRETKDEGGSTYKEFLFVEWDKGDTGRFTIWRGEEIPKICVTTI